MRVWVTGARGTLGSALCNRLAFPLEVIPTHRAELDLRETAATFAASLELARQGRIEIRQSDPFAPLRFRRKP